MLKDWMFVETIEEQQNEAGVKSWTRNDDRKKWITEILSANWKQTKQSKMSQKQ